MIQGVPPGADPKKVRIVPMPLPARLRAFAYQKASPMVAAILREAADEIDRLARLVAAAETTDCERATPRTCADWIRCPVDQHHCFYGDCRDPTPDTEKHCLSAVVAETTEGCMGLWPGCMDDGCAWPEGPCAAPTGASALESPSQEDAAGSIAAGVEAPVAAAETTPDDGERE